MIKKTFIVLSVFSSLLFAKEKVEAVYYQDIRALFVIADLSNQVLDYREDITFPEASILVEHFINNFNARLEQIFTNDFQPVIPDYESDIQSGRIDPGVYLKNQIARGETICSGCYPPEYLEKTDWRVKMLEEYSADVLIEITAQHSPWAQTIKAQLTIYDRKQVVLSYPLEGQSGYIISDYDSPYLTGLESSKSLGESHFDEMKKVYADLGIQFAEGLQKDYLNKKLIFDEGRLAPFWERRREKRARYRSWLKDVFNRDE